DDEWEVQKCKAQSDYRPVEVKGFNDILCRTTIDGEDLTIDFTHRAW
ncbi:hypothetical protein Tco_1199208, partial [Tanacetum coccineum]